MLDRPNPVQPARPAPRRGQHLPRDVSEEILLQLWAVIGHPRDQVWFTLMLRAGLRVGEVVRPKRGDILTPATPTRPARLRVEGKGRKERVVYLSADAYAVLDRWLQEVPGAADTPLCPNRRGQAMTVNGLQERLRHYCRQAGVAMTCHQLRHTFARQLVEHDLPVAMLSKLMGHDRLSTTQLYLAAADPQVRQAYAEAMARWDPSLPPPPAEGERPLTRRSPRPHPRSRPSPGLTWNSPRKPWKTGPPARLGARGLSGLRPPATTRLETQPAAPTRPAAPAGARRVLGLAARPPADRGLERVDPRRPASLSGRPLGRRARAQHDR